MKVGIDLDGTLAQSFELWEQLHPEFEIRHLVNDMWAKPEVQDWYNEHHKTIRHLYKPYPGARAVLEFIDNPIVLTARPTTHDICPATALWLEKRGINLEIIHEVKKDLACKEHDITVHIEDSPAHALEVARVGIPVLLKDQPYNQDVEHENIIRFTHWLEVPRLLKKLNTQ